MEINVKITNHTSILSDGSVMVNNTLDKCSQSTFKLIDRVFARINSLGVVHLNLKSKALMVRSYYFEMLFPQSKDTMIGSNVVCMTININKPISTLDTSELHESYKQLREKFGKSVILDKLSDAIYNKVCSPEVLEDNEELAKKWPTPERKRRNSLPPTISASLIDELKREIRTAYSEGVDVFAEVNDEAEDIEQSM